MNTDNQKEVKAFNLLFEAAIFDAVDNGAITQLKLQVENHDNVLCEVRLVVMPEKMSHEWSKPLGTPIPKPNAPFTNEAQ